MRNHHPGRQSQRGVARYLKRPKFLVAMNQNEDWPPSTATSTDGWEAIGEVATRVSRRWWLDE